MPEVRLTTLCLLLFTLPASTGDLPAPAGDLEPFDLYAGSLIHWPDEGTGVGAGMPFQRVVLAELMPDAQQHAVALRGGYPVVLYSPRTYRHLVTPNISGVQDLGVLHGTGLLAPDAIAYTSAAGLFRVDYDEGIENFASPALIAAGSWAGCTRILCADLNADGRDDVLGLAASGSEVLFMFNKSTGWVAGAALVLNEPIVDFAVGDFDANPIDLEIAVLSDSYLSFFEGTAPHPVLIQWLSTGPAIMAPFHVAGGADRIALAFDFLSADEWFLLTADALGRDPVWAPLQFQAPDQSGVTWIEPVSMTAVDADGDGKQNLFITHRSFGTLIELINSYGPGQPFFDGSYLETAMSPEPELATPVDNGLPAILPLDLQDGVLGLFPLDSGDGVFVSTLLNTELGGNTIASGGGTENGMQSPGLAIESVRLESYMLESFLHIGFSISEQVLALGYDHVQFWVWRENSNGGGLFLNERNYICEIEPPQGPNGTLTRHLKIELDQGRTDPGAASGALWSPSPNYFVHARLVQVAAGQQSQGPPPVLVRGALDWRVAFTVQTFIGECKSGGCAPYLESLPLSSAAAAVIDFFLGSTNFGGAVLGSYITTAILPPVGMPGSSMRQLPGWGPQVVAQAP